MRYNVKGNNSSRNEIFARNKNLRAGYVGSNAEGAGRSVSVDRTAIGFAELRYAPA